jgi:hypothetical protein
MLCRQPSGAIDVVRQENAPKIRADLMIAFAGPSPDLIKVEHVDVAAAVSDHPCLLQLDSHLGNACSPDAHHLGKKFLRQQEVGPCEFVHPQTGVSIEVFYADRTLETFGRCGAGWFWWNRRPGFAPDGERGGPFATSYATYRHAMNTAVAINP